MSQASSHALDASVSRASPGNPSHRMACAMLNGGQRQPLLSFVPVNSRIPTAIAAVPFLVRDELEVIVDFPKLRGLCDSE